MQPQVLTDEQKAEFQSRATTCQTEILDVLKKHEMSMDSVFDESTILALLRKLLQGSRIVFGDQKYVPKPEPETPVTPTEGSVLAE